MKVNGSARADNRSELGGGPLRVMAAIALFQVALMSAVLVIIMSPILVIIAAGYFVMLFAGYFIHRGAGITVGSAVAAPVTAAVGQAGSDLRDALRWVDLYENLTDDEMDAVASLGKCVRVPAGEVLGKAGGPGEYLYAVVDGKVQLSAPSAIGEITVRVVGPGESVPLACLVEPGTLITTMTAMTDTELLAFPRAGLLALWEQNPVIGMHMATAMSGIMTNRYRATLQHLTAGARQALAAADFWANV